VLVASDRAIPRALTSGQPIVVAEPRSKAAGSYGRLAQRYLAATARQSEIAPALTASNGSGLRRRLRRKAAS
jgi:MinD-like ATPase involved in chromosome partitioning or flagellar assembly